MSEDEKTFGELLREWRERAGLSREGLAQKLALRVEVEPGEYVKDWETNFNAPHDYEFERLIEALSLSADERKQLQATLESTNWRLPGTLRPSEGAITESSARAVLADMDRRLIQSGMVLGGSYTLQTTLSEGANKELEAQLKKVQSSIERLAEKVHQQETNSPNNSLAAIAEDLQDLKVSVAQARQTSQELTAPILLPDRDTMAVRVVPIEQVGRLEEYRAEQSQWSAWFGVFVGSVIGVLVNVATGGTWSVEALLMLAFFVALGIVTWNFEKTAEKRGNDLIRRLLSGQAGERGE